MYVFSTDPLARLDGQSVNIWCAADKQKAKPTTAEGWPRHRRPDTHRRVSSSARKRIAPPSFEDGERVPARPMASFRSACGYTAANATAKKPRCISGPRQRRHAGERGHQMSERKVARSAR
jgi:hypothetical protein